MQEYKKKTAQRSGQQQNTMPIQPEMTNGIPNSALQDVMAGKKHATSEMMGHSQNLAPSIAAKMSQAFGMDLTGMQVYRSDAMVGSGMQGVAQGNKIVLSSDVDLNTTAGQAVLGHEISHIHAQSQGIGMGNSGLYENAALEHQADTEGLLAAQGRSIYSDGAMDMGGGMQYGLGMQGVEGMTTLGGGMSAGAGAPMQAKKTEKATAAIPEQYEVQQDPKPEERKRVVLDQDYFNTRKKSSKLHAMNARKFLIPKMQEEYGKYGNKMVKTDFADYAIPEVANAEDEMMDEEKNYEFVKPGEEKRPSKEWSQERNRLNNLASEFGSKKEEIKTNRDLEKDAAKKKALADYEQKHSKGKKAPKKKKDDWDDFDFGG